MTEPELKDVIATGFSQAGYFIRGRGVSMYLSVGYSIGWFSGLINKIETQDVIVNLDHIIINAWLRLDPLQSDSAMIEEIEALMENFPNNPQYDTATSVLDSLVDKGVAIFASSNIALYNLIKDYRIIRNGVPNCTPESLGSGEVQHIMYVDDPVPLSFEQLDIWRTANWKKTVGEVYAELSSVMDLTKFMDNLLYLKREFMVFLA